MTKTDAICHDAPVPQEIRLTEDSLVLEYETRAPVIFSHHFLRCASPVAGECFLKTDHKVKLVSVEPVGRYAIQCRFSDGFDGGIYDWEYLFWLAEEQSRLLVKWREKRHQAEPVAIYSAYWSACKKRVAQLEKQEEDRGMTS